MTTRKQQLFEQAQVERRRCASWLVERMRDGKPKALTKAQYREQAMAELGVSKNSFDAAWVWAIEDTGCHDWYHGHALSIRKLPSPRAH
jgi:hypothetical protein